MTDDPPERPCRFVAAGAPHPPHLWVPLIEDPENERVLHALDSLRCPGATAPDEPPYVAHKVCPYCVQGQPLIGAPVLRWCGITTPMRGVADLAADPAICADCQASDTCATCGAQEVMGGVLGVRPGSGRG